MDEFTEGLNKEFTRLSDKYGDDFDSNAVAQYMQEKGLVSPSEAFRQLTGKLDTEDILENQLYGLDTEKVTRVTHDSVFDDLVTFFKEAGDK